MLRFVFCFVLFFSLEQNRDSKQNANREPVLEKETLGKNMLIWKGWEYQSKKKILIGIKINVSRG